MKEGTGTLLGGVLRKARFWESISQSPINERQRSVLNRLLDGFEGKLTTTKWAKLTTSSQDTATRDIQDLVEREFSSAARKAAAARLMLSRGAKRMGPDPTRDGWNVMSANGDSSQCQRMATWSEKPSIDGLPTVMIGICRSAGLRER